MRRIMVNVYYAHSILIYNTKREKKELRFLRKKFSSIFNPNTDIIWDDTTKMEPYFRAVKNSDILVVSELKNHIGKGVFDEIKTALNSNILVLCLRRKFFKYSLRKVKDVELLNEEDWKTYYGKVKLAT